MVGLPENARITEPGFLEPFPALPSGAYAGQRVNSHSGRL